jgi:hypothetical protein
MSTGAVLLLALLFLAAFATGILILVLGVRQIRHGRAARTWPVVDAQLQKCAVENGPGAGTTTWYVALQYTYCVAGVRYAGATLAIGAGGSSWRKKSENDRRSVLAMARFTVRYNPDQPDMSAVFLSRTTQIYWVFCMGIFWLGGASCMALLLLFMTGAWHA